MKKKYIIILLIMITAFLGIKNINAAEIKPNDLLSLVTTVGELPSSGFGDAGESCADLVGENLGKVIKLGIDILRIAGAIIAIVNGMLTMIKAVTSKDPGMIKKAGEKCMKMGIILLVIGVFPTVLRVIAKLFGYDLSCIF